MIILQKATLVVALLSVLLGCQAITTHCDSRDPGYRKGDRCGARMLAKPAEGSDRLERQVRHKPVKPTEPEGPLQPTEPEREGPLQP